jgi:hypothetical protein
MGFFIEAIAEVKHAVYGKNGFPTYCTHEEENKLNLDIFNILLIISKFKTGIKFVLLSLS